MGSTGKSTSTEYKVFSNSENPQLWFADKENSNLAEWALDRVTTGELSAIEMFTGSGFISINDTQYNVPWEDMLTDKNPMYANNPEFAKKIVTSIQRIHDGLSKFELKKPIVVTRQANFRILGMPYDEKDPSVDDVKKAIKNLGGTVQNDGFMSFSADSRGRSINGSGLTIKLHIPESTGAGAFVGTVSQHEGEKEFLVNNNTVMRLDPKSVRQEGGTIVVDAYWEGQAEAQTISPTYTGRVRPRRKKK